MKKPHRVDQQVVKVHGVRVLQAPLVGPVGPGNKLQAEIRAGLGLVLFRGDQAVFGVGDGAENGLVAQGLFTDFQIPHHFLHQAAGIVGVVDGEMAAVAQPLPVPAEHAGAAGMEGHGPYLLALGAQHGAQAFLKLPRRFVGEGDGHNLPGQAGRDRKPRPADGGDLPPIQIGPAAVRVLIGEFWLQKTAVVGFAIAHQVGDAVDQHGGFAAACPGQNKQGTVCVEHRLLLALVHAGKVFFQHLAAQGEYFLFLKIHFHVTFLRKTFNPLDFNISRGKRQPLRGSFTLSFLIGRFPPQLRSAPVGPSARTPTQRCERPRRKPPSPGPGSPSPGKGCPGPPGPRRPPL